MATYVANAFSTKMLKGDAMVSFKTITEKEFNKVKTTATSAVGHEDTARVLNVQMNRISVQLDKGDVLYIAQLEGGRLPEGVTTLPDGFAFGYIKCEII